eukprot:SAG31_NODE_7685_length_1617_cov_1.843874_2_plen_87_part_00
MRGEVCCIGAHHDSLLANAAIAVERENICTSNHACWHLSRVAMCNMFAPLNIALAPDAREEGVAPTTRIWKDDRLVRIKIILIAMF